MRLKAKLVHLLPREKTAKINHTRNEQAPQEPGVSVPEEKKPSILDRILGRDKPQAPADPNQPSENAVATASDCYDGYCDNDGIIARANVNRGSRATNRVHRDGVYNRGNMDRAYRTNNRVNRGRVVDGSVGDRPGIIGDEGHRMHRRGDRSLESSFDRIGRGVDREVNRADRAVDRAFDGNNNMTRSSTRNNTTARTTNYTMWGVIIGLVIAAAVITLMAVLIPRRRHKNSSGHRNF
jgi:hypothetical protein